MLLSRQPLRRQVLAVAGALVVLLAILVIWAGSRTWRERQTELRDSSALLAQTVAAALDHHVLAVQAIGAALEQHPAIRAQDAEHAAPILAAVLARETLLRNIVLVSADGRVVASAVPIGATQASQPVLQEVLRTGKTAVSGAFQSPVTGQWTAAIAMPVRVEGGAVAGVLGLVLDLERLPRLFSEAPLPADGVVTVLDRAGRVLTRNVETARFLGTDGTPLLTPIASGVRDLDGVERLGARVELQQAAWQVVVAVPVASVQARVRTNWFRNIAVLTVWLGISLGVVLWGAMHTSARLGRLRSLARRIADGNLDVPIVESMPNLEQAQLQDAFAAMAARLRDARDLQDRQVRHERQMNRLLQSMQLQMLRHERLAAVGQLVSGVAHEINNPLQAMLGSTEMLQRQQGVPPPVREEAAFMQAQAVRMREIVRSLARFSDPQLTMPEPVELREVVEEVQQLRARELQEAGIELTVVESGGRQPVHAGFADLTQVLLNLVINAEQALRQRPTPAPRIVVRLLETDRRVRCEVEDNGPGVRIEDEARLFQPFFTTRLVGEGAGLGLAISYGIVRSFGGTIGYFRNALGGATFYIELPAMMAGDHGYDSAALLRRIDHPRV